MTLSVSHACGYFLYDDLVHNRFNAPNNVLPEPREGGQTQGTGALCLPTLSWGRVKQCLVHKGRLVTGTKMKGKNLREQNMHGICNFHVHLTR